VNTKQSPTPTADVSVEFYNLPQVAKLLHCSVRTVRRYLADGRLGYSQEKKGGVIRVSAADVAAYYEASRRGPAIQRRRTPVAA
jgi:excisionase family DNA binding protein